MGVKDEHIQNPFAGHEVGADWEWHARNGFVGGTDYKVAADKPITAPADGVARRLYDSVNSIEITLPSGRKITLREVKAATGSFPRNVKRGERIGTTGLVRKGITRWPHIDATVKGKRVKFEALIYTPKPKPAPKPKPKPKPESTRAKVRRVARYLNRRHLGRRSTASITGARLARGKRSSNYYWMIQTAGRRDGLYPRGKYVVNGIPGPRTRQLEAHYARVAK
jgi:hypothetical protein